MRRLSMILSMITLIVLSAYIVPASAQGGGTPRLLADITVNDSRNNKFPSVTATGQTVILGGGISSNGGSDNTNAYVWTLAEQATSIGAGVSIGPALGKPDYSTVALGTASDGTVYAVWGSIDERRVYLRRRDTAGVWGPQRDVRPASGGFPIFPQVAISSGGQVFVAWQDIDKPLFLTASSDQGVSWPSTFATSEKAYSVPPGIAAGPSGQVAVGFTTINLNSAVAVWNGSGLTTEIISSSGSAADTTASVGPDGKIYAAWRGLDSSGANSGVHYAERQAANSWAQTQLLAGEVKGSVNVVVDSGGTIHLGWIANASGSLRFYYAFRQSGQPQFSSIVSSNTSGVFNSRLAVSSSGAFAHASLENFSGDTPFIAYARFSGGTTQGTATPQIEGGAEMIKRQTSVSVGFLNVTGSPTQVRWRWGDAPTDSATDSGGWQTFTNPMTITVPDAVLNAATCDSVSLYTQVRDASLSAGQPQSDSVVIDAGVTADVELSNPHMPHSSQFSSLTATLGDFSQDGGASNGHPNYTRDPAVYVGVVGVGECSGIEDLATGRSTTTIAPATKVTKDSFSNVLPIPGAFSIGSNLVLVRVSDKAGNFNDYTNTLIFDATAPVLNVSSSGQIGATSNADATILTSLKFANISVTDNLYPGRGFWGAWIANSRTEVADPANDSSLIWHPVAAPGSDTSFTIADWSLASGLKSSQLTAGDYFVYVRFLDGAGNPTASVMPVVKITLAQVTFPTIYVPMLSR